MEITKDTIEIADDENIVENLNKRLKTDLKRKDDMDYIIEGLATRIATDMKTRFTIPSEEHYRHHTEDLPKIKAFVDARLEHDRQANETLKAIKQTVISNGIIGLFSAIGIFTLLGFIEYIKRH